MSKFSKSVERRIFENYPNNQGWISFDYLPQDIRNAVAEMIAPFETAQPNARALFVEPETCPDWLLERFARKIDLTRQIKEKRQKLEELNTALKANPHRQGSRAYYLHGFIDVVTTFVSSFVSPPTENELKEVKEGNEAREMLKRELEALDNSLEKQIKILSGIPAIYQLAKENGYPETLHEHLIQYYEQNMEKINAKIPPSIHDIITNNIADSKKVIACTKSADSEFTLLLDKLETFYDIDLETLREHDAIFHTLLENLHAGIVNDNIRKIIESSDLNADSPVLPITFSKADATKMHALLAIHVLMELESANSEFKNIIGLEIDFEKMGTSEKIALIKALTTAITSNNDQVLDSLRALNPLKLHLEPREVLGFSPEYLPPLKESTDIVSELTAPLKTIGGFLFSKGEHLVQRTINENHSIQLLDYFFSGSLFSDYLYYLILDKKNTKTLPSWLMKWGYSALILGVAISLLSTSTFVICKYILAKAIIHSLPALTFSITAGILAITGTVAAGGLVISSMIEFRGCFENAIQRFFYGVANPERFILTKAALDNYDPDQLNALQKFFKKEINHCELQLESMTTENISERQTHNKLLECWGKIQSGSLENLQDIRVYCLEIYKIRAPQFSHMIETQNTTVNQEKLSLFLRNIESKASAFLQEPARQLTHPLLDSIKSYLGFSENHPSRQPILNNHMDNPDQKATCERMKVLQSITRMPRPL